MPLVLTKEAAGGDVTTTEPRKKRREGGGLRTNCTIEGGRDEAGADAEDEDEPLRASKDTNRTLKHNLLL